MDKRKESMIVTLQQMTDMALGTDQLDGIHIELLYHLIDILLKKLDCQKEKISIGGFESKLIQGMLKNVKEPVLQRQDYIIKFDSRWEKLHRLEFEIGDMDYKFNKHERQINQCQLTTDAAFLSQNWSRFPPSCEQICFRYEDWNEKVCKLLQNTIFIKKILALITDPMVKRLADLEKRLDDMQLFIKNYWVQSADVDRKVFFIQVIIAQLEKQVNFCADNEKMFTQAMLEMGSLLDAKLGKIHLPPLRSQVRKTCRDIREIAEIIKTKRASCPRGDLADCEIKCLSCLHEDVKRNKSSLHKYMNMRKKSVNPPKKICHCKLYTSIGSKIVKKMEGLNIARISTDILGNKISFYDDYKTARDDMNAFNII